jgi:magnesium and cobalt transporter
VLNKLAKLFNELVTSFSKKAKVQSKTEVIQVLKDAASRNIVDKDSLPIIEAVLQMDRLKVKDIMLPRHKLDFINIKDDVLTIGRQIIGTGHSRFPVIENEISNIVGIFHSKDLIHYLVDKNNFSLREYIREAYFVPEVKHLDALMYEMRVRQTHLAIVVDEFTNVVGMITLEMIVEQLIGEIEDEYDLIDGDGEILEVRKASFRIKGYCKLKLLSSKLSLNLEDEKVETIGGYIVKLLGRVPVNGEIIQIKNLKIEVVSSDSRKINLLLLHLPNSLK